MVGRPLDLRPRPDLRRELDVQLDGVRRIDRELVPELRLVEHHPQGRHRRRRDGQPLLVLIQWPVDADAGEPEIVRAAERVADTGHGQTMGAEGVAEA